MGKKLRLLFIGNSHTYYNDMPLMAAKKARAAGYDCEVTMIAHGGWFLAQHVAEPDVRGSDRWISDQPQRQQATGRQVTNRWPLAAKRPRKAYVIVTRWRYSATVACSWITQR